MIQYIGTVKLLCNLSMLHELHKKEPEIRQFDQFTIQQCDSVGCMHMKGS